MLNLEAWDAPASLPPGSIPAGLQAPANLVTARYADRGFLTRTTDTPANVLYEARLMGDVDIGQSVVDALTVGGQVALTVSEPEFWNGDDVFNAVAAEGRMDGRTVRIRTVPVSDRAASDYGGSLAAASLVWAGQVARVDALGLRARLGLSDVANRLTTQLQSALYDGAGGTGGAAELKGLPKPVSIGRRFNVTPVLIGNVDLGFGALPTYQSHFREIAQHEAVRIRGVPQSQVSGVAPSIGQWLDVPGQGMFQLGSAADGPVTCDVKGDAPSGRYARSIPDILRVLLRDMGPALGDGDFDAWSWFDVGNLLNAEVGWGIGAEAIASDTAIAQVLASLGAFLSGTRAGQVRLSLLGNIASAPDLTLQSQDCLSVEPQSLPADLQPAPQAVEVLAARNWTPLEDIAGSVTGPERAALTSPGSYERALSSLIAARSTRMRTLRLEGLYRAAADAQARAAELRTWLERGLRMVTVTTDRYLGQVELGHTASVTYPYHGLSNGWTGTVVAWREKIGARRLELTIIG